MRFGWCVFPLLLGVALASPAFADPPTLDPAAEARRTALFEEGRKLHLNGKHAEAVVKLQQVVALRKSPQALRALGLAEQDAGKVIAARSRFEEALRLATESGLTSEIEPAKRALEQVAKVVARVRVKLPAEAVDASLKIDGVGLVLKDGTVDVDPGSHTLTAEGPGLRPFAQTVVVAAGRTEEVDVKLVPDGTRGSIRRPIGIVVTGVGAAGLVAGAVTGILAIGAHDDLSKTCAAGLCPDGDAAKIDAYHTLGTVSTVSLVAGGVLAATGAVLWITAPRAGGPSAARRITPLVGAGTAGVRGTF